MKNIPQTILIVASCVALTTYKDLAVFSGINKTILSGILGAVGAGLGALTYQIVSNKSDLVKYFTAGGLALVLIFGSVLLTKKQPEPSIEDKLTAILDSAIKVKTNEIIHKPIEISDLKAPNLTPEQISKLITCEVCGYVALAPESPSCYNCFSTKFDPTINADRNKWLRDEQLFWFSPDEKSNKVMFFEPKIEDGFKKDPTWKPVVTEKEVLEYNKNK